MKEQIKNILKIEKLDDVDIVVDLAQCYSVKVS